MTVGDCGRVGSPSQPAETLAYDADGNLTSDAQFTYGWDAENRLTSVAPVSPTTGDKKITYGYDYQGRRAERKVYDWNSGTSEWDATPSESRAYVYYGRLLLLEYDTVGSSPVVLKKYTWGLDLAGQADGVSLEGAGGIGGLLACQDVASNHKYLYFADGAGNIGQLVDITSGGSYGTIAAKYEYDVYGQNLLDPANSSQSGPFAASNPFRFSTKPFDNATGLGDWGLRWYSPRVGRWLNRDPLGELGGGNLLSYVRNRPSQIVDAIGLQDTLFIIDSNRMTSTPAGAREFIERNTSTATAGLNATRLVGGIIEASWGAGPVVAASLLGSKPPDLALDMLDHGTDTINTAVEGLQNDSIEDTRYVKHLRSLGCSDLEANAWDAGKDARGAAPFALFSFGRAVATRVASFIMKKVGAIGAEIGVEVAAHTADDAAKAGAKAVTGAMEANAVNRAAEADARLTTATTGGAACGRVHDGGRVIATLEISESKYPQLAENIRQAQKAGHPDVLTYGGNAQANRAGALEEVPNVPGLSRDEYPFASTMEGGKGSWVGHIPPAQQSAQGGLLSSFYRANNIQPGDRFRVTIVK